MHLILLSRGHFLNMSAHAFIGVFACFMAWYVTLSRHAMMRASFCWQYVPSYGQVYVGFVTSCDKKEFFLFCMYCASNPVNSRSGLKKICFVIFIRFILFVEFFVEFFVEMPVALSICMARQSKTRLLTKRWVRLPT